MTRRKRYADREAACAAGVVVLFAIVAAGVAGAQGVAGGEDGLGTSNGWPSLERWVRVLTLQDYNTRLVVGGTALLGLAAGVVGSFTLLRKRALVGDALSHATLPGIALAFIVGDAMGMTSKSLLLLLAGATVSGVAGVGVLLLLAHDTAERGHRLGCGAERIFRAWRGHAGHRAAVGERSVGRA